MESKDINSQYIKDNFDLEKERSEVEKPLYNCSFDCIKVYDDESPVLFKDFINGIRELKNKATTQLMDGKRVTGQLICRVHWEHQYCYHCEFQLPKLVFTDKVWETDEELIKRLITRERKLLGSKKAAATRAMKKEAEDMKKAKQLARRYPNKVILNV